jgi:hypothetical protein
MQLKLEDGNWVGSDVIKGIHMKIFYRGAKIKAIK